MKTKSKVNLIRPVVRAAEEGACLAAEGEPGDGVAVAAERVEVREGGGVPDVDELRVVSSRLGGRGRKNNKQINISLMSMDAAILDFFRVIEE